tara:strand:+ start:127 stop:486 length:360 start_codon:yes stop_codon:yes gene_type:complete
VDPHSDPEALTADKFRRKKNILSGLLEILVGLPKKTESFWGELQDAIHLNRVPSKDNILTLFAFIDFLPATATAIPSTVISPTAPSTPYSASNSATASTAVPVAAASPVSFRGVSGRSV